MADWNLIEMLAKIGSAATGSGLGRVPSELAGGSGGRGYMSSAQASPMPVQQPSSSGPMGGPIQSADTIGHGVPRASLGRGDAFMRALTGKPALPAAGERQQMFADFPRYGYDPTQRRY